MAGSVRDPRLWHLPLVVAVSAAWESLFLFHGLSELDEAWPLYAAMRLRAGGTLYGDVLFVFPPGHLLAAWLGSALDPPGLVAARIAYAAANVGLCAALYALARRLMPASFALLAALLVAVAAPRSHQMHLLFGYRYLVFCVLALLAFARYLRGGELRWMGLAGLWAGVACGFRLTPAAALVCGVGAGLLAAAGRSAASRADAPGGLRAAAAFAAGLVAVVAPLLAAAAASAGLPRVFAELVEHPLAMLQPLPLLPLHWPEWSHRGSIFIWFAVVRMWGGWVFYAGYLAALAWRFARGRRDPLLLAVCVFGAVFFVRSLGRSDEAHLDSAMPPLCLLAAHALSLAGRRLPALGRSALCAAALAAWIFLSGSDLSLRPAQRGLHEVRSTREGIAVLSRRRAGWIDAVVETLEAHTAPGERVLCLGATPLFYVLSGRPGPGSFDIVMPGTFRHRSEEHRFVQQLRRDPPAAVVWSAMPFDNMPSRSVQRTAPLLSSWVARHYQIADPGAAGRGQPWLVMLPTEHMN